MLTTSLLPGIDDRGRKNEFLIENDGHPAAPVHERIATYLVEEIIGAQPDCCGAVTAIGGAPCVQCTDEDGR